MFKPSSAAFALILAVSAGTAVSLTGALADSSQELISVQSNAFPGETFDIKISIDPRGELAGMTYTGGKGKSFTLGEIQAGVILMHDEKHDLDVVGLQSKGVSPINGGLVRIHYVTNGLFKKYSDFYLDIRPTGSTWTAFTDSNHGKYPVHSLYLHKATLGIDHVCVNSQSTCY